MTAPRPVYGPRIPTVRELWLPLVVVALVTYWVASLVIVANNVHDPACPDSYDPGCAHIFEDGTDG